MSEPELRDTFGDFLVENGEKFKNLVVLDADLSSSTKTFKFAKAFPNRFFNMGIAEQNMVGAAIGFAISRKIPIVSGFSIFTTGRAWEFIRLACHDNLNIKLITTHSGFVGEDGSTHHSLEDLTLMSTLPNMTVLVPADNVELVQMLNLAFNNEGPFYIRLPRGALPSIHKDDYVFSIGKPDVIKEGEDICLISTGYGCSLAYQSIPMLERQLDISLKVINLSSLKPIDKTELIKEIRNVKAIVTIEEHNIYCGFGSIVARLLSETCPIPMKIVGVNDSFGQSGNRESLLKMYGLNIDNISKQIKLLLNIH